MSDASTTTTSTQPEPGPAAATVMGARLPARQHLAIAADLWQGLQPWQKAVFYGAAYPLCWQLNEQQAAACGERSVDIMGRVRDYCASQPPEHGAAIYNLLQEALRQRMSRRAGPGSSTADARPPPSGEPPGAGPLTQLQAAIAYDEADPTALAAVLHLTGFSAVIAVPGGACDDGEDARRRDVHAGPATPAASDVRLVTRVRQQAQETFWPGFVAKCRLAWDVFFPNRQALSPAGAVRARLQMILVSDRSGLDLPTLMHIRNQSLRAIAQSNGWDNLSELELQVATTRASGEQVMLALPLADMPTSFMLRDEGDYDYEHFEDDDDYDSDGDEHRVGEIMEAPAPGSMVQALDTSSGIA